MYTLGRLVPVMPGENCSSTETASQAIQHTSTHAHGSQETQVSAAFSLGSYSKSDPSMGFRVCVPM